MNAVRGTAVLVAICAATFAAAVPPEMNSPVNNVETDKPYVALTFDDGPDPVVLPKLLDLLKQEEVRATFYLIGNYASEHPGLVKRILAEGHEIGNHTMSHANLTEAADAEAVRKEIMDAQELLTKLAGNAPATFRAPFLAHDGRVWAVLGEAKLPSINARVITVDYDESVSAEKIYQNAVRDIAAGDVVLCHSWREATLEVMPRILAELKAKGLEPVTVSKLLAARIAVSETAGE